MYSVLLNLHTYYRGCICENTTANIIYNLVSNYEDYHSHGE